MAIQILDLKEQIKALDKPDFEDEADHWRCVANHWKGVAEDYIAKYEKAVLEIKELGQFNTDNLRLREENNQLKIKLEGACSEQTKAVISAFDEMVDNAVHEMCYGIKTQELKVGDRVMFDEDTTGVIQSIYGNISIIKSDDGVLYDRWTQSLKHLS